MILRATFAFTLAPPQEFVLVPWSMRRISFYFILIYNILFFEEMKVSRLVTQMRDQLNLKEKKLQTLQTAIAMLKQELVAASQAIAEKSIRENREEYDTRNKDNKNNS
jgi:hypothetical protein